MRTHLVFVRAALMFLAVLPCTLQAQTNLILGLQLYAGLSVTGEVGKVYQIQYATELSGDKHLVCAPAL